MARRRLDQELVRRALVESREQARRLVGERRVLVNGAVADKPARLVDPGDAVHVSGPPPRFVGRGGEKLAGALEHFGVDPSGRRVVDAGASTGGFTDCLLQAGADTVIAVDVGRAQLHERLRGDQRVVSRERTDIRHVSVDDVGGPVPLVVADLSFISLRSVLGHLVDLTTPDGELVVLVKPQFEAGRAEVSKGRGVIRDPRVWRAVLADVADAAAEAGAGVSAAMVSPLRGGDGNVEFVLHLRRGAAAEAAELAALLDAVVATVQDTGHESVAPPT